MNNGPVVIVINEEWEKEIYKIIWEELECDNELALFDNAEEALVFILKIEIRPLLIVSDIKLPGINGCEFRELLFRDKRLKCKYVPFIFRSNIDLEEQINSAFDIGAVGYFIKGTDIDGMRENITTMINYWRSSEVPNS